MTQLYANVPKYDDIIMIDRVSERHLIVFGLINVYWRNALSNPQHISWSKLKYCNPIADGPVVHLEANLEICERNIRAPKLVQLISTLKTNNMPTADAFAFWRSSWQS